MRNQPLYILVFSYLLSPPATALTCAADHDSVTQAWQRQDLETLATLLPSLQKQCSWEEIDPLQRQMSQLAVTKAKQWLQAGNLEPAKQLLLQPRYAPFNSWEVQAVLGEIAWRRKEWATALGLFNQALDLLDDPNATPIPPAPAETRKVYRLAVETQLLTGTLQTVRGRGGEPGGSLRPRSGWTVEEGDSSMTVAPTPVPVQFVFGKATFTNEGIHSAKQLVEYFKRTQPHRITLIGHTDAVGSDNHNCELSKQRAIAVKNYLVAEGLNVAKISTLGKGEGEPLSLYDPSNYTQEHIDQLNRRVEFALDKGVEDSTACR